MSGVGSILLNTAFNSVGVSIRMSKERAQRIRWKPQRSPSSANINVPPGFKDSRNHRKAQPLDNNKTILEHVEATKEAMNKK